MNVQLKMFVVAKMSSDIFSLQRKGKECNIVTFRKLLVVL